MIGSWDTGDMHGPSAHPEWCGKVCLGKGSLRANSGVLWRAESPLPEVSAVWVAVSLFWGWGVHPRCRRMGVCRGQRSTGGLIVVLSLLAHLTRAVSSVPFSTWLEISTCNLQRNSF